MEVDAMFAIWTASDNYSPKPQTVLRKKYSCSQAVSDTQPPFSASTSLVLLIWCCACWAGNNLICCLLSWSECWRAACNQDNQSLLFIPLLQFRHNNTDVLFLYNNCTHFLLQLPWHLGIKKERRALVEDEFDMFLSYHIPQIRFHYSMPKIYPIWWEVGCSGSDTDFRRTSFWNKHLPAPAPLSGLSDSIPAFIVWSVLLS